MTCKEVLAQAIMWLQQDKRVSYRSWRRRRVARAPGTGGNVQPRRRGWDCRRTGAGGAGGEKSALVEGLQVRAEGLPRIAFRCSPYHTLV